MYTPHIYMFCSALDIDLFIQGFILPELKW